MDAALLDRAIEITKRIRDRYAGDWDDEKRARAAGAAEVLAELEKLKNSHQ